MTVASSTKQRLIPPGKMYDLEGDAPFEIDAEALERFQKSRIPATEKNSDSGSSPRVFP